MKGFVTVEVDNLPEAICAACSQSLPCIPLKICRTDERLSEDYISSNLPLRVTRWVWPEGWREIGDSPIRRFLYCPACAAEIAKALENALTRKLVDLRALALAKARHVDYDSRSLQVAATRMEAKP